ncbi:MAG: hypothetical protein IMF02_12725 [Proteobacteria bacterium]|nr:hypothetical protein [Pseudomonadota bacterium]
MDLPAPANKKPPLEQVQEQFAHWRRSRAKRGAIPDALWQAAIMLFPDYGLHRISKALRLNYTDLKHRVNAHRSTCEQSEVSTAGFIELGLSDPMPPGECIIEMADQKGASMRMYFKGETGLDILELGKAFWSKPS